MKRSRLVIGLFLLVVAGVCCFVFEAGDNIPKYKGQKYNEWLSLYQAANYQWNCGQGRSEQYWESRNALLTIGTNALPWLLNELCYERPAWKGKLDTHFGRLRYPFDHWANWLWNREIDRSRSENRWLRGIDGLEVLGVSGSNGVPQLERLLTDSNSRELRSRAIYGLRALGEPGFICLSARLSDEKQLNRRGIAWLLGETYGFNLGTTTRQVVSALVNCLDDRDGEVAFRAMEALGKLRGDPNLLVPIMAERLHDPRTYFRIRAAISLAGFREEAESAVPALLDGLEDPDPRVSYWCSNAVFWIAPVKPQLFDGKTGGL